VRRPDADEGRLGQGSVRDFLLTPTADMLRPAQAGRETGQAIIT
jgi:hypothetical protein